MDFTRLITRRLSSTRRDIKSKITDGLPLGPPVFIQHLTNCEIIENSAARFECKVSGNPEPEVEWYKDGRLLKESKQLTFLYDDHDNCKLIITKGTAADAGEYTVVAENPHGKVSSTAQLVVDTGSTDDETASESELSELSGSETEERTTKAKEEKITKYYTIQEELGKGRFGVVCKCIDNKTGRAYAAKFIKCTSAKDRQDVIHEADIMNSVRHKRLLRLQDFFQTQTEMILVMELVTGGELFEKVVEDEFISEIEVSYYMKQILEGIQHLHQREVLHLDLKPENIMLIRPDSKQVKLIDFGLARKYNPKENLKVMFGTPEFVAPEVIKYERITPATDLWSIGVIAYILLSGLSPFMGDTDAETLTNVQLAEWDFDDPVFDEISEEAKDFISNLLVLAARKRHSVDQCLSHRWFSIKKGKKLKTDRLKAFTARRKWKRAITAIRSTNFLSRILGSRGADSDKKSSGGGGSGLLARVKAMHAAGVQSSEGGSPPASSPFLSPASAALSTSNSFTKVIVSETKRAQGQEETIVTTKETVSETKGGIQTVETRRSSKTTRRNDENTEEETSFNTEVENGSNGAANTPEAVAKRYTSGGIPLKLESVDKYWGIKHELARGRFAVVKRCLDAKTKKPYVAKIIKYDDDADRDESLQEFEILRKVKSDKIVMLRDAFLMRKYIVLIMDLLEGQDILSFIASKPRPNEEDIAFVIRPLLDVLSYLHGQYIVHLDLRPANIFIAKSNLALKLIDFGSAHQIKAKDWKKGENLAIVSYNSFTAPELVDLDDPYLVSGPADMWSIGVLLYALMSGELPFAAQTTENEEDEDEAVAKLVKRCKWSFDSKAFQRCTSEVKSLISSLITFDQEKRPTVEQAKNHPWILADNLQKRRSSDVNSSKLKDLSQQLMKKDKEDVVTASCVLRTFSEDPYDSPDSDEE